MVSMKDYYNMLIFLCTRLSELEWFYSPRTFKDSVVDLEKIQIIQQSPYKHIVVPDRNILDRLIKIITTGNTNQGNIQDIAILMSWCAMLNIDILPYYALNELATGSNSEEKAQYEYAAFSEVFHKIDLFTWMALAIGAEKENKKILNPIVDMSKINTHFNMESVDYLANYASLLHFAYVYRTENSNNERFKKFFQWYYDNSKVSRFMETYICSVLSQKPSYKAPKNINSSKVESVIRGCQNQARDLCYLTELSIDRIPYNQYEMILISDDKMLGNIFLNGCYNIEAIRIYENSICNGRHQISEWVNNLLSNHHEFTTEDYTKHFQGIIGSEIQQLKSII